MEALDVLKERMDIHIATDSNWISINISGAVTGYGSKGPTVARLPLDAYEFARSFLITAARKAHEVDEEVVTGLQLLEKGNVSGVAFSFGQSVWLSDNPSPNDPCLTGIKFTLEEIKTLVLVEPEDNALTRGLSKTLSELVADAKGNKDMIDAVIKTAFIFCTPLARVAALAAMDSFIDAEEYQFEPVAIEDTANAE